MRLASLIVLRPPTWRFSGKFPKPSTFGSSVQKCVRFFLKRPSQNRVPRRTYTILYFPRLVCPLPRETVLSEHTRVGVHARRTAHHTACASQKTACPATTADLRPPTTDHDDDGNFLVVVVLSPRRNDSTTCRRARARRQPDHHATAQPRIALRKVHRHTDHSTTAVDEDTSS